MGDQGRLYVNEDVVPAYKSLLRDADLILPNQFEAEYVTGPPLSPAKSSIIDHTRHQAPIRSQNHLLPHPRRSSDQTAPQIPHPPHNRHLRPFRHHLSDPLRHRLHRPRRRVPPPLPDRRPGHRLLLQRHGRHVRRSDRRSSPRSHHRGRFG